jgi:single-stranded-DNA-specific exonuclease
MSLLGKQWVLENHDPLALFRTYVDDETVAFHDPFLMGGMERAVQRIEMAIQKKERVLIFGDYDVDGISGTAILVHTLRELGAQVTYRLPDRKSGYGLNATWIEEFKALPIDVLITVDCGISNHLEVVTAAEAGIDVIVTDHHTLPEQLPSKAHTLLHPNLPGEKYPFPFLAGAGVAFKLAVALMHTLRSPEEALTWRQKCVDLASLGTIADCMPLIGENRWIAKQGIDQLRITHWEGLRLLLQTSGSEAIRGYDSDVVGFRIGPRLNASGRLDTPYYALQLLLNENGKAQQFAEKLEEMNNTRKTLMEKALQSAEDQLHRNGGLQKKILIGWSAEWPSGLIGLIAGRLAEKYHRPTIIMEHRDTQLIGSCRSIPGFHVVEALHAAKEYLKTFGGHAAAAGFTLEVEKLPHFLEKLEGYAEEKLTKEHLLPQLHIASTLHLEDITLERVKQMESRAPYGEGNPKPRFLIENIQPANLQTVGREHTHLKFDVRSGKTAVSAIAFKFGPHYTTLQQAYDEGKTVDVVFELQSRQWKQKESIQFSVIDLKV